MNNYKFNGQREGEKVLSLVKTHPFVLIFPGLKAFFFIAIAAVLLILLPPAEYFSLLAGISLLIAFFVISQAINFYKQSVILFTDQRIISIEQKSFFSRRITEVNLKNIQDISSVLTGFFNSIVGLGDLVIRTAGSNKGSEIVLKNIYHPYDLQQEISSQMGQHS